MSILHIWSLFQVKICKIEGDATKFFNWYEELISKE